VPRPPGLSYYAPLLATNRGLKGGTQMATKCPPGMQWPSVWGQWTSEEGAGEMGFWAQNPPPSTGKTFDLIGQLFAKALNKKKCCIFDAVLHIPFFPHFSTWKRWQVLKALVLAANNLSERFQRASNCHSGGGFGQRFSGTNMKLWYIMHGWHGRLL